MNFFGDSTSYAANPSHYEKTEEWWYDSNIISVGGRLAIPGLSVYHITEFA
jgi:hypothetical protein